MNTKGEHNSYFITLLHYSNLKGLYVEVIMKFGSLVADSAAAIVGSSEEND